MKKKALFTELFLLILSLIILTGNATAENIPVTVIPERVFRFEPVWDGDTVTHDFILTNTGKAPLEILKIEND